MKILDRLKKSWENDCPEKICSCGNSDCNCQENNNNEPEFVLKENLSDEEIEEIIETEYKDKDKDETTIRLIRKGLKKYGNRFTYYKFDIPVGSDMARVKATVTCHYHGDFEITASYFVGPYGKGCYECRTGKPRIDVDLEVFEKNLHEAHPYYSIIPGESVYVNNRTDIKLHCDKHNKDFYARPYNLIWGKCSCPDCVEERLEQRAKNRIDSSGANFLKKIEEKYPGKYDLSEAEYIGFNGKRLTIKCNTCGEVIDKSVSNFENKLHNGECLCPKCRQEEYRLKREANFKARVEERFPNHFDLTNVHYEGRTSLATGFKCLKCGKIFDVRYPGNFIRGAGCPHCDFSIGESYVRNWLANNTANSFAIREEQLTIDNSEIVGRTDTSDVIIDFSLSIDEVTYWIEYNGEQHYTWCKHFQETVEEFEGQLRRDQHVRDYCKSNNIILIEIPYTYDKQEKVDSVLVEIILNHKKPEDVITIPSINYYRTKKDREEAIKDGRL